jgi:hypothetical protein
MVGWAGVVGAGWADGWLAAPGHDGGAAPGSWVVGRSVGCWGTVTVDETAAA